MTPPASPTFTFEERIKYALVPPWLYHAYLRHKTLARGEPEFRLVPFLARRDRISVDAGANKGIYSRWLARHSRHVHAFEPNPKFAFLFARAQPANLTFHALALAEKTGTEMLRIPYGPKGFSNQRATLNPNAAQGPFVELAVEARRLDDYDLDEVGFIKIDVEGFENAVLAGADRTIARSKPNLLIEIEEAHTGRPIEESLERVLALGYAGFFLEGGALRSLDLFDPETDHRKARAAGAGGRDYVFNFIFLPAGEKPPAPGF